MPQMLQVECQHIEGELMRVQFANSQLVSDHPKAIGGQGTGPSPGEMVLWALASAGALAGMQHAVRNGLRINSVGSRASLNIESEGFPGELQGGPLSRRTYIGRLWRLFEADGELSESEQEALVAAMSGTRVARTLHEGLAINEELICHRHGEGRSKPGPKNPFHDNEEYRRKMPEGTKEQSIAADSWRIGATALDEQTCLLKSSASMCVIGSDTGDLRGPTPEELLLGGLAACTTIYLARNAAMHEIPAESVRVWVSAEIPDDPGAPIAAVEKRAEVVGDLTDREIADLEFMAEHCAIGETLLRGVLFADQVAFSSAPAASASVSQIEVLTREAPAPADPEFCDDGSCCVPE